MVCVGYSRSGTCATASGAILLASCERCKRSNNASRMQWSVTKPVLQAIPQDDVEEPTNQGVGEVKQHEGLDVTDQMGNRKTMTKRNGFFPMNVR